MISFLTRGSAYITKGVCPQKYTDCNAIQDDKDSSYALVLPIPLAGVEDKNPCAKVLQQKYGLELCRYYKVLEIYSHTHDEIVVYSSSGYGRRNQISVQIGNRWSYLDPLHQEERYMRYLPPAVTGFEVHSGNSGGVQIYRPDGITRIVLLGNNLGYVQILSQNLNTFDH